MPPVDYLVTTILTSWGKQGSDVIHKTNLFMYSFLQQQFLAFASVCEVLFMSFVESSRPAVQPKIGKETFSVFVCTRL